MKQIILKPFLYDYDPYNYHVQNYTYHWIRYYNDYIYSNITVRSKL